MPISDEERARLLDTLASFRGKRELEDARIAAIVNLALHAAIRPSDALAWSVSDVVQVSERTPDSWRIKSAVAVRSITTVLPLQARASLLLYLALSIRGGKVRALNAAPFFGHISLRSVQHAWLKLRARAQLPAVTFHDLISDRRQQTQEPDVPTAIRIPRPRPRILKASGLDTPAQTETAPKRRRRRDART